VTPGLADDTAGPERADEQAVPAGAQAPGRDAPPVGQPEPDATEPDPAEGATAEDPVATLTRERDEYLELAQRTRAEFDNYRKRVAAESDQAVLKGRAEVAEGVIGALDNLERAMEAEGVAPDAALEDGFPEGSPVTVQGMVVAYRDLVGSLARAGIEQFDPAGDEFDPNLHEAIQAVESEGAGSGVVIEVLQRGYRAGDQVIRAARVVVSK
jgi:molecular chaperone GrpE